MLPMRRTLLVLLGLLLLSPAGASATSGGARGSAESNDDWLDLPLPDVDGWERTPPRDLPPESGGGYSVGYNAADGTAVTVYVYRRGLKRIPNDLTAEAVLREFEGAKAAVLLLKRRGLYDEASEEESGRSTLGGGADGRPALYARFLVKVQGRAAVSEVYVLPHRDHFIKLRVTRLADPAADEADRAPLAELYAALNDMLGGGGEGRDGDGDEKSGEGAAPAE